MVAGDSAAWGMNLDNWDWVPGVGVISILHYYERTKAAPVLTYLKNWVERNKDKASQVKVINSMAPFAIFPELYDQTGNRYYLDTAVEIGNWMIYEAPRTREGAFEHTVTEKASFPEQVWADTLFMAVLFLARLARLTNQAIYAQEALKQVQLHFALLEDPMTGVLFHGWNCRERNHMSAARWTRANAWVAVGVPGIIGELKALIDIPKEIFVQYQRLIDGLVAYQSENGLWHTVMDRPDFYQETSGSAGIACGILKAIEGGYLDSSYRSYANRALDGILAYIDEHGAVGNVSGGTPIMPTIERYQAIPIIPTLYGQGLVLMLLAESLPK